MSAPVTDRPRVARQRPVRRGTGPSVPTQRQPSQRQPSQRQSSRQAAGQPVRKTAAGKSAAQRAYAKRADRWRQMHDPAGRQPKQRRGLGAGRLTFVLMVMALLAVGLIATLWLSTAATADSYRLGAARSEARELSEQSERLRAEVAAMQAAPSLAKAAGEVGMVPTRDVARLVVAPDGTVTLVGVPKAVAARPPPPPAPAPASPTDAAAAAAAGAPGPASPAPAAPAAPAPAAAPIAAAPATPAAPTGGQ